MRAELKSVLPSGVDIVGNDYHGNYFLTDRVVIGDCNVDVLAAIGDRDITALALALPRSTTRLPSA